MDKDTFNKFLNASINSYSKTFLNTPPVVFPTVQRVSPKSLELEDFIGIGVKPKNAKEYREWKESGKKRSWDDAFCSKPMEPPMGQLFYMDSIGIP